MEQISLLGFTDDTPEEPRKFVYEPEFLSKQERLRKQSKAPKLNELVRDGSLETSVLAAQSIQHKVTKLEQVVLSLLKAHPDGLTIAEMCQRSGKEKPSLSPRTSRLEKLGLIYRDGTRLSNNKRSASIYKLS